MTEDLQKSVETMDEVKNIMSDQIHSVEKTDTIFELQTKPSNVMKQV